MATDMQDMDYGVRYLPLFLLSHILIPTNPSITASMLMSRFEGGYYGLHGHPSPHDGLPYYNMIAKKSHYDPMNENWSHRKA